MGAVEETLEQLARDRAKERGWGTRKLGWIGRRGAPDRYFGKPGVGAFLVEFKAPGESPNALQWKEINFLRDCGWIVHVIDNLADAYALFD